MTTQIEAMKMMLEVLEEAAFAKLPDGTYVGKNQTVLAAGRAAIEAAEKVEPIAWMTHESAFRLKNGGNCKGAVPVHQNKSVTAKIPLYLSAPSAEIEELRRDAARYQWLKKHKFRWNGHCWHSQFGDVLRHTDIDAAIDSAMQEKLP